MSFFDFLDEDNDGSAMDDMASTAASAVGGGLTVAGGLLGAAGGAVFGAGLAADASVVGLPAGIPANIAGGLLMGAGALTAGLGQAVGSDFVTSCAEEVGDFTADAVGTRGPRPVADRPIGDDHYRNVVAGTAEPGYGARLHKHLVGQAGGTGIVPFPGGVATPPIANPLG